MGKVLPSDMRRSTILSAHRLCFHRTVDHWLAFLWDHRGKEMFVVDLNRDNFEYDVHSIVQAFYPGEQIKVLTPGTGEEKRRQLEGEVRIRIWLQTDGARLVLGEQEFYWEYAAPQSVPTQEPGAGMDATDIQADYKYGFKCFLYQTLCQTTGRRLPWGNLTGIRPTKIAMGLLEQGKSDQEILAQYQGKYYVSQAKAQLSLDIAHREQWLLRDIHHENGYSLYIGIPFCPSTCLYCSFTSFPIGGYRKLVDTYVDCLVKEMEAVAILYARRILDTVYIGGGTPTTLEPSQLERLLGRLKELFDFSRVREFTVEAGRADSITEEKLAVLRRFGVTRISVNPQTMKQETLDFIGRKASVEQVVQAFGLAREQGFDNINMDLILGLPGETKADVQYTIDRVVELAPDSLTVHSLAIKRASKLNLWIQENGVDMLRNTDATMAVAARGASKLQMAPYYLYRQKNMSGNFENVGYAREGKYGLYNILIMEEVQTIVACGAGSVSKRVYLDGLIKRSENVKDVSQYIERIGEMIERKRVLLED